MTLLISLTHEPPTPESGAVFFNCQRWPSQALHTDLIESPRGFTDSLWYGSGL